MKNLTTILAPGFEAYTVIKLHCADGAAQYYTVAAYSPSRQQYATAWHDFPNGGYATASTPRALVQQGAKITTSRTYAARIARIANRLAGVV